MIQNAGPNWVERGAVSPSRLTPSRKSRNHSPQPSPNGAFCWQPRLEFFCPLPGCVRHGHEQVHGSPPGIHREAARTERQSALSTELLGTRSFRERLENRSCSSSCWTRLQECFWAPPTRCPRQGVHMLASVHGCHICTGKRARRWHSQRTPCLWVGLQETVVQGKLPSPPLHISPFTKHLWLQPLIPVRMPVPWSAILLTEDINHWHSSIKESFLMTVNLIRIPKKEGGCQY